MTDDRKASLTGCGLRDNVIAIGWTTTEDDKLDGTNLFDIPDASIEDVISVLARGLYDLFDIMGKDEGYSVSDLSRALGIGIELAQERAETEPTS